MKIELEKVLPQKNQLINQQPVTKPVEAIEVNVSRALGALQDKLIQDCTEEEFKPKLALIYSMVGLRPHHWPVEQEKEDLHNYIRLKYGKKTLSELILAFDLAINNELDLKPDDIKVYDQFTIAYLAQIMTGYKKWLSQQSKQAKKTPLALPEARVLTLEEKDEWINEWVNKEEINIELIPVIFYDYLIESGKISVPNNEQRVKYLSIAVNKIEKKLLEEGDNAIDWHNQWNLFQMMKNNGFEGQFKDRILTLAQKLIIFDYLKPKT